MAIEILLLGQDDRAVLENVAPDVFDDLIHPGAVAEFLGDSRHKLMVAMDDGVVVGMASAVIYVHPDDPRPELWLNEVGVAASHHREGIGRRLIAAMLDVARSAGCAAAWVLTDRENHAAMRLYEAAGGREAIDDVVMFEFDVGGGGDR